MIIRSQDKKIIINLDNIDTIGAYNDNAINVYNGTPDTRSTIGVYSTEEKAIKVLDMIQEAYVGGTKMVISNDGVTCYPIPVVFQMPQDEEVEV